MAFVTKTGVTGKIYVPEKKTGERQKHACRDCFACQLCSDDRCQMCLACKTGRCDRRVDKKHT
jgi:hypothetical protein